MMRHFFSKNTVRLIRMTGFVFMLGQFACDEWAEALSDAGGSSCYTCSSSDYDYSEDALLVEVDGESALLTYNNLAFSAVINWTDGNYYFSPDPDGKITGTDNVCLASISEEEVEGSCFRDGHVCQFSYYTGHWVSADGMDAYYLRETDCKTAGDVGPFLVPLENPLCGEAPYPACPTKEDLFPTGETEEKAEDPIEEETEAITEDAPTEEVEEEVEEESSGETAETAETPAPAAE